MGIVRSWIDNNGGGNVSDAGPYPFASVFQDDLFRLGMIDKFSLYNDTEAAQFEKNIRPVFPVNVNCLGIRRNTEPRYKYASCAFTTSSRLRFCVTSSNPSLENANLA